MAISIMITMQVSNNATSLPKKSKLIGYNSLSLLKLPKANSNLNGFNITQIKLNVKHPLRIQLINNLVNLLKFQNSKLLASLKVHYIASESRIISLLNSPWNNNKKSKISSVSLSMVNQN
jgi:hypothetical protein